MNNAMKYTTADLTGSLQKALYGIVLDERLEKAANLLADDIFETNAKTYPGLESRVRQTGPLSWSISFSAPGMWNTAYGSQSSPERGFETRSSLNVQRRLP